MVHWHHFAYMIISLALLGFGASGTFLALAHRALLRHFAASYLGNVAAFAALVIAQSGAGQGAAVPSRGAALGPVAAAVARADLPRAVDCRSSAPPTRSASR